METHSSTLIAIALNLTSTPCWRIAVFVHASLPARGGCSHKKQHSGDRCMCPERHMHLSPLFSPWQDGHLQSRCPVLVFVGVVKISAAGWASVGAGNCRNEAQRNIEHGF